jgi:translation initiation factor 1
MRPESRKRIDTSPGQAPLANLEAAFAGVDLPGLPMEEQTEPPALVEGEAPRIWKMGRVLLRRETAHRGGRTVIVIHDFATHLPAPVIETVARKLRAACGCGGTVKVRTIEMQGDQPAKIRAVLEREGFQVAGVK